MMRPHPVEPHRDQLSAIADVPASSHGDSMAKSTCPVTRAEFRHDAQPLK